jgi:hypothetical protein
MDLFDKIILGGGTALCTVMGFALAIGMALQ